MADWARWVTAAEPALGWREQTILTAYRARCQDAVETALDGDPIALAIRNLTLPWSGMSSDLLAKITPANPPKSWPPKGWPESPRGLSGALRRLAPQLRRVGIEVRLPDNARTARERVISVSHTETTEAQQDRPDTSDNHPTAERSHVSDVSYSAPIVSPGHEP